MWWWAGSSRLPYGTAARSSRSVSFSLSLTSRSSSSQSLPYAAGLAFVASAGFAASLPLQERLVDHTESEARGQVFGLSSTGLMVGQAVGALLGGAVAQLLGPTHADIARAMAIMAGASLVVTLALTPSLRRSCPAPLKVECSLLVGTPDARR